MKNNLHNMAIRIHLYSTVKIMPFQILNYRFNFYYTQQVVYTLRSFPKLI